MKIMSALMLFVALTGFASAKETSAEQQIRSVLANQQQAWNNGDIDGFMQGYWKSDKLRFASGNKFRHGWQATLDNYKKSYPDKATMGQLKFTLIDIDVVSNDVALVFGRWHLTRDKDQPQGLFTLVFERKGQQWLVTRDHTSSQ